MKFFSEWNEREFCEFIFGEFTPDRIKALAEACEGDHELRDKTYANYMGQMRDLFVGGKDYTHYEPVFLQVPEMAVDFAVYVKKGRWPEAEPQMSRNGEAAARYALEILDGRWPEAEPVLAYYPSAATYAQSVLKRRWLEAEPAIARNGGYAVQYAINVIKGRWEEAEAAMSSVPNAAYYAGMILHRRWPEAEAAIIADAGGAYGSRCANYYAEHVIGGRWPEAEPEISKLSYAAYYYAKNILKRRWPECEQHMLASRDPQTLAGYAVDFMENRWIEAEDWINALNGTYICTYHYARKFFSGKFPEANAILPEEAYQRWEAQEMSSGDASNSANLCF